MSFRLARERVPSWAPPVERLWAQAFTVPTATPESDGTLRWSKTTMVLVRAEGAGRCGIGYTYGARACTEVVHDTLRQVVQGQSIMDVERCALRMLQAVRNDGRRGIAAHAISAVDIALWDLKARVLDISLADLLGRVRDEVSLYASGGFTSYDRDHLVRQLSDWAAEGFGAVKMKVGRAPCDDAQRVAWARGAVGDDIELFVDANGAYVRKQAVAMAHRFATMGVTWFEEPVSADDLEGLTMLCRNSPPGMRISAGEYVYDAFDVQRLLRGDAVDVLQADATRCLGLSGFMRAAALAEAACVPLSCHTAPSVHVFAACACAPVINVEWFFDHVRIEHMFFDGALEPHEGMLRPDRSRPGLGIELKKQALERYAS